MCIPIQWKSWKVLSEANVQRAWQQRNIFVIAALLGIGTCAALVEHTRVCAT